MIFDTLAFSIRLREAGMPTQIADTLTFALRDILVESRVQEERLSTEGTTRKRWMGR
jgi:hypothetical protein